MTTLQVTPLLEVDDDSHHTLWPVVGRPDLRHLPLHGDLTDRETGTAVHQILRWFCHHRDDRPAPTVEEYLARLPGPDDEQPLALGALRFTDTATGVTIMTGCCFSLDERSTIRPVLDGRTPHCWLGHDPDTEVTIHDGHVQITQDPDDPTRPVLRYPPEQVRTALARAETDLDRFCDHVAHWAHTCAPTRAHLLQHVVSRALDAGTHRSTHRSD